MSVWEVHVKQNSGLVTISFDGQEYHLLPGEALKMVRGLVGAARHAAANKEAEK